jgi:hypothetical protein
MFFFVLLLLSHAKFLNLTLLSPLGRRLLRTASKINLKIVRDFNSFQIQIARSEFSAPNLFSKNHWDSKDLNQIWNYGTS